MRRMVYFSFPAHGHINPTLPVVRELVGRQQPVIYYSTEQFRQAIQDTGAQFRSYGAQFRMPAEGPGPFAHTSTTLETFLELSCAVLHHHLEQVRALAPTHILYDSFAPWGRFVAQLLRLPTIASVPSILINADIAARYAPAPGTQAPGTSADDSRLTAAWYAAFQARCKTSLRRYQFGEPPSAPQLLQTYGDLNLVYTSSLFQPSADAFDSTRFQFVGPSFAFRPEAPAFPFEQLDGRPLVLISLGTVYGNQPRFFHACLKELAGAPWQVVLATGGHVPLDSLGPLPENFIVRPFVPQIEILARAAAFVTHGGMNSVQEALYHGVPLVMAPQGADQFWISARASELGAAVALDLARMEPGAIRASIQKVLSEPSFPAAGARLARSLRAAGGHLRACDEIQSFVRAPQHANLG